MACLFAVWSGFVFLFSGFCSVVVSVGLRFGLFCSPPPSLPPLCCLLVLCVLHLSLASRQQQDGEFSPAMAPAPTGPPPRTSVLTCLLLGDDSQTRGVVGWWGNRGHCDPTHDNGPLLSNHGGTPPPTKPSRFARAGLCRVFLFHHHLGIKGRCNLSWALVVFFCVLFSAHRVLRLLYL